MDGKTQHTALGADGSNGGSDGGESILVVDDDASLAELLRRLLERHGFRVTVAPDGTVAHELLSHRAFEAIVSDIQMPGLDGIQLLRRVRERDLDVPVILVTGDPSLETAVRAIEYGALRYLAKPLQTNEFVAVVQQAVRMSRLARVKREALRIVGGDGRFVGDRAGLEVSFDRALQGLWMAFQPIVAPGERRVFGYEARLRSREPSLPHPGAVLDAAERLDRVHVVGRAVRDRVAEVVSRSTDSSIFFVNLHARDLLDDTLLSPESPLARVASRVVLEITERASLEGLRDIRGRIRALRAVGFRLAVDDLGAGYAGLTSFANIEPEVVKIDMSLVRGIGGDPMKRKIVDRLTALAHELNILVVAEGIESEEERDALGSIGCDLLQGYLFAKPGPPFPSVQWSE